MTPGPNTGCRAWTTLAALPPAVLAHDHPRSLAPVLGGALPASPIHDERRHARMPLKRRGGGADRWGRSIDLPVADPAAAQTRWPEAPMDDR